MPTRLSLTIDIVWPYDQELNDNTIKSIEAMAPTVTHLDLALAIKSRDHDTLCQTMCDLLFNHFIYLTCLRLYDAEVGFTDYISRDEMRPIFFDGLLRMKNLQQLTLIITSWRDSSPLSTGFTRDLCNYLTKQQSLTSLKCDVDDPELLVLLLQSDHPSIANIQDLSLDVDVLVPVKRSLDKLTYTPNYPGTPGGHLADLANVTCFTIKGISMRRLSRLLKEAIGIRELTCLNVERSGNSSDQDLIEGIDSNLMLEQLYISFLDGYEPANDVMESINTVIQDHPTIRNKDTWSITAT
ncbi:hypothetical protein SAMD00019534_059560 [Acytostelium subglobosum LB1]|uniref:hypothetical protein n=1 Tax=Acytostelium subglobosum LB1 TaxID=1410327 RepID=UPI000644F4A4|nr:hypothetical protein SAMD00019534_059560 [Acytostelium subglobosum LB1]GAM22781.1 hypothetical protein SAMD00019534_059560 [Acytostelium subglobosum LB1]|eukprot:XP_012754008.1 hypothetical protein SAMD00019534_059560 [Acytostelium subglobosum LB1]